MQVIFVKAGKRYQRIVYTDKKGKKYVNFGNKKVPLSKLKIVGQIMSSQFQSISTTYIIR